MRRPDWAGHPLGAHGWTAGKKAVSAYLIRSRPSGRKINSRACCYCRAGGRAVTGAQHNIYTAGWTHIHMTLAHIYLHMKGEQTLRRVRIHTHRGETGWTNDKGRLDPHLQSMVSLKLTRQQNQQVALLCLVVRGYITRCFLSPAPCLLSACEGISGSTICLFR